MPGLESAKRPRHLTAAFTEYVRCLRWGSCLSDQKWLMSVFKVNVCLRKWKHNSKQPWRESGNKTLGFASVPFHCFQLKIHKGSFNFWWDFFCITVWAVSTYDRIYSFFLSTGNLLHEWSACLVFSRAECILCRLREHSVNNDPVLSGRSLILNWIFLMIFSSCLTSWGHGLKTDTSDREVKLLRVSLKELTRTLVLRLWIQLTHQIELTKS